MNKPNVVVIFPDQLRRHALGCYGDPNVSTPNIDRLAAQGFRFDCACSTFPVCVPFRFTFMTGEYAHTRGVAAMGYRLSPAEPTLADAFNNAGYATTWIGKWHLSSMLRAGMSTVDHARQPVPKAHRGRWQRFLGFEYRNDHWDTWYFENDDPEPKRFRGFQTDGMIDVAIAELDRVENRPFCMVISPEPPHPPLTPPEEDRRRWVDRDIVMPPNVEPGCTWQWRPGTAEHCRRLYYAMVENLDRNVGRLLDALAERQLAGNTIVVLLSDHGELDGAHGHFAKNRPYEESVGIPFIVFDPRKHNKGARSAMPVCSEDIFPTLCGLCGVEHDRDLPGLDLSGVAQGGPEPDRDAILLQHVAARADGGLFARDPWRAVRTHRYTYAVKGDHRGAEPWQLFDNRNDPWQLDNLIQQDDAERIAAPLHARLRELLARYDDDYPLAPAWGIPGYRLPTCLEESP
jgi:arylsulfatase A-like enzyme